MLKFLAKQDQDRQTIHTLALEIAELPVHRILALEAAEVYQHEVRIACLADDLVCLNQSKEVLGEDEFQLKFVYEHLPEVKAFVDHVKDDVEQKYLFSRVQSFFPRNATVSAEYRAYFSVAGPPYRDYFVRSVPTASNHEKPQNESAIVVNLGYVYMLSNDAPSVTEEALDSAVESMNGVMAHELFHVMYARYREQIGSTPPGNAFDRLLDTVQNEGIGHYVDGFPFEGGRYDPADLRSRFDRSIVTLNHVIDSLSKCDPGAAIDPADELAKMVLQANQGRYWDKYAAIAGMFMARAIDQTLGRQALASSLTEGPQSFFHLYAEACEKTALPQVTKSVLLLRASHRNDSQELPKIPDG